MASKMNSIWGEFWPAVGSGEALLNTPASSGNRIHPSGPKSAGKARGPVLDSVHSFKAVVLSKLHENYQRVRKTIILYSLSCGEVAREIDRDSNLITKVSPYARIVDHHIDTQSFEVIFRTDARIQ